MKEPVASTYMYTRCTSRYSISTNSNRSDLHLAASDRRATPMRVSLPRCRRVRLRTGLSVTIGYYPTPADLAGRKEGRLIVGARTAVELLYRDFPINSTYRYRYLIYGNYYKGISLRIVPTSIGTSDLQSHSQYLDPSPRMTAARAARLEALGFAWARKI
jgi:hypothetical protein